jgi:hypothetical protein
LSLLDVLEGLKLRGYCLWQRIVRAGHPFGPHLGAEPGNPLALLALHHGKQARFKPVPAKRQKSYTSLNAHPE